jgi:hypothetical protein
VSHDDRSSCPKSLDGEVIVPGRRRALPAHEREARDVDVALHRHRDAVERTDVLAAQDRLLSPLGLCARTLVVDVHEGVQPGLVFLDPTEEMVHDLDW